MKSQLRLFYIPFFMFLLATSIIAQTNTGTITLHTSDLYIYSDGSWVKSYVINVTPNTPIKINYTLNSYDYLSIYTIDNNLFQPLVSISQPTNGSQSCTFISTTGKFYFDCCYGWNGMYCDPIFSLTYAIDPNYTTNSTYNGKDAIIAGKMGIGTSLPREKLDVNGSAIINERLAIGTTVSSDKKVILNNITDTYSLYSYTYKYTTSSIYGLYSNAYNPIGNIYGIYSTVSGQTGKKWAGYFTGGDLAVMSGNMGIGVDNPQGILQVRGTYDNSWIYFSSNAGMNSTKYKPKVGYGLAFTWNYSGGAEESIINYSGSSNARLDFTSWDGTNLSTEMTLKKGRLGIGTTTPQAKLDVGSFIDNGQLGTVFGRLSEGNPTGDGTYLGVKGYGTQPANYNGKSFSIEHHFWGQTNSSINFFRGSSTTGGYVTFNTDNNSEKMRINANGNVSIGTTDADPTGAMLTVKGKIHANEVIIDVLYPIVPDFVFHPSYNLMPLSQVEQYVKTNSHLPEIPSAGEISKNGLSIGEMQNKLLQKVEELTLYVIEQQKEIELLKKQVGK